MTDRTPKLLVDALGDAVDDEIVFLTVTDELDVLKTGLERLLTMRGWAV